MTIYLKSFELIVYMGRFRLEIFPKKTEFDPVSGPILRQIKDDLGISSVENASFLEFFDIELNEPEEKIHKIAKEVFSDPITQGFSINPQKNNEHYFSVEVKLLQGMTDNTAIVAERALEDFLVRHLHENESISFGRKYSFKGKPSEQEIQSICTGLLSNSQIEEFLVEKNE